MKLQSGFSLPDINRSRLLQKLDELTVQGATGTGGVNRIALGNEDKQSRDLLVKWMRELELEVTIDQVGNIIGVMNADGSDPVMTGSHIDSVANGGRLDGPYGIVAGLESIHLLREADIRPSRPLAVAVFTNEEGVRYQPDMMGSLVYCGGLSPEQVLNTKGTDGTVFGDELERTGYAGEARPGAIRPHAFIELHIEQGPILEQEALTIGVVENLQGISWVEITITGQANHAGTTPMHLRRDAGYVAALITTEVRRIAQRISAAQVATVGVTELKPNLINVVPSSARITVDLRNADKACLKEAEASLSKFLEELQTAEGVEIKTRQLVRTEPVIFDPGIAALIERAAKQLGHGYRRMTSGAGHDAQMMARICPAAMIFVPSIGGISHNAEEDTDPDHLVAGVQVLMHSLMELAGRVR